jgi:hypothetical protein
MKLEEMRHRETQEQHFGKRGMSYHGAAVFVSKAAHSDACDHVQFLRRDDPQHAHPYQTYFFDDLIRNSQQQDAVATLSLIEATLARVRRLFPEIATVSIQSDNAAAYASPFLLFLLPVVATRHGLRVTEYIHNEAGDGKTVLDGHFGVQTHMLRAYVDEGHDITTPEQAAAALRHKPIRNTLVSLVEYDEERLRQLGVTMGASSVFGSAQIRHCTFAPDGSLHLSRQVGIGVPSVIPVEYVRRVVATLQPERHANGTVTGVSWDGDAAPAYITRSVLWKPQKRNQADEPEHAGASVQLPFTVVTSKDGSSQFLECDVCARLFLHVAHYSQHTCKAPPLSRTVKATGQRLAVARGAIHAREPGALLLVTRPLVGQPRFLPGWARPGPREASTIGDRVAHLLTQWFDEGETSRKTKCSAARALERLRTIVAADDDGDLQEDDLPDETHIKRFFSSLAAKRRKERAAPPPQPTPSA